MVLAPRVARIALNPRKGEHVDSETLYRLAVLYGVPIEVIVLEELNEDDISGDPYEEHGGEG